MSAARIIRQVDCPEVAWKNGGGRTRELAVFPPGAGVNDFLWRLSMARVEQAGAFSRFEGVDRVLAVVDGTLRLSGAALDVRLDADSAPVAFDGASPITGEPLGGEALDLNAMARRGHWHVEMLRLPAGAKVGGGDATFLLALDSQRVGGTIADRLDCVQVTAPLTLTGPALLVRFSPD